MPATALIRASHPGPCLLITAIVVAVAARAGAGDGRLAVLGLVVLAGQLSIGWSNDAFDLPRDRAAQRTDKPLVAGDLPARPVWIAAAAASAVGLLGAFGLGLGPGAGNALLILPAWAYNAGLKATSWSGAMYVLGFAPVPALAATAAGAPTNWWMVAASGALGLGGHFTNVLSDLAADAATGVRGLPQQIAARFGTAAVRLAAVALLVGASLLIVLPSGAGQAAWLGLIVVAGLAAVGISGRGRRPFYAALAIAVVDVALFIALT